MKRNLPITVSWIFWIIEPIKVWFWRTNCPSLKTCRSDITTTSHLQTPLSFTVAFVSSILQSWVHLQRHIYCMSIIVAPSGSVQVTVAWGLLSRPLPQTREALSPIRTNCSAGPCVINEGASTGKRKKISDSRFYRQTVDVTWHCVDWDS
jgi:hypothetical protein